MGKRKNRGKKPANPAAAQPDQASGAGVQIAPAECPAAEIAVVEDKPAFIERVQEEAIKVVEKKPVVVEKIVKDNVLEDKVKQLEKENATLKEQVANNKILQEKVKQLEKENSSLSDKIIKVESANDSLNAKLDEIIIPNEDEGLVQKLKDENKTLCDKISSLEKTNKEQSSKQDKLVEELRAQIKSLNEKLKTSNVVKVEADDGKVCELEQENCSLREKVDHYQSVLADTNSLLQNLQFSVEKEEAAWKEKAEEKESKIQQLSAEKSSLEKKLEDISQNSSNDDSTDEVKVLKEKLQSEQKLKEKLEEQLKDKERANTHGSQNGIDKEIVQEKP